MEEPSHEGLSFSASAPLLQLGGKFGKALVLTTPRRHPQQPRKRQRPQALRPLSSAESPQQSGAGISEVQPSVVGDSEPSVVAPLSVDPPRPATSSPIHAGSVGSAHSASSSGRPMSSANPQKRVGMPAIMQGRRPQTGGTDISEVGGGTGSDSEGISAARLELVRLRKQLHRQAEEFQKSKDEVVQTKRELWQVSAERDDFRLKLTNLERIDRTKSQELLEERRKNDEMSKQVKEMSANLLSLTGSLGGVDGGNQEGSGLRKRCFKLVQQNTSLSVQCRLLQRQKGWAEAKARVLQNEVTRVYLGVHDRVKDDTELEAVMLREFAAQQFPTDEAQIYQLLMPLPSVHQEAITDFLTHITHTHGMDIHGFLHSSRVFSEGIRNECLSGLAREFYATWRRNATLPHILRAVERVVHLSDYLVAFESFSTEITSLLGCAHAKIWVVDRFRQIMWSCVRDGDGQKTFTLKLPKGKNADLTGQGIATAAYLTQKPVSVGDAREDPRFLKEQEGGPDGHAKSIMCVPVCRITKAGRQPQVRVVLQAVDKLQEPHFDPDRDGRVLRLLGKVSMEVLQVCETSSAATMNTKRKEALLQLFTEHTPCDTATTLLAALERGLADTFLSQATALHVVNRQSTMHITLNKHQNKLSHVTCDGMKGIIGMVAKTMNQNTQLSSQIENSRYDSCVDLPIIEKTVIHTVPICEGSGCVAVCQFICPEREKTSHLGDDGAYHPENTSHYRLLHMLLTFVQNHLFIVNNPPKREDVKKPATPKTEDPQASTQEHEESEEGSGTMSKDKKRSSADVGGKETDRKRSVSFGKNTAKPMSDEADMAELNAAALKIQSIHRGRLDRRKSADKLEEKRASRRAGADNPKKAAEKSNTSKSLGKSSHRGSASATGRQ